MTTTTEPLVLSSDNGNVRTLTLNRPAALNSFTTAMHAELMAGLEQAAQDPAVRCVVLTGAGRGFCAGQDLADPAVAPDPTPGAAPKDLGDVIGKYYGPLVKRIRSMPVPVVAAVNGVAAGAGANLALCCDIVVATRSASFIQAFTRIGLLPDTGGTWLLPRLVGTARAMGMALLGDKIPADEAARMGLIWQVVDDGDLTEVAETLGSRLAAMPVKALVATRNAMHAAQGMALDAALDAEKQQQSALGAAHDYSEGVDAFRAKRSPKFTDR